MIIKDLATALKKGFKQVDEDTAKKRIEICEDCPMNQLTKIRQCKKCWCFMDVKTKLEGMKCDLNFWI